tara:strand:+ start:774 stop:1154 length:381 start_codon:yes stop_codon:yes gene_type:complete
LLLGLFNTQKIANTAEQKETIEPPCAIISCVSRISLTANVLKIYRSKIGDNNAGRIRKLIINKRKKDTPGNSFWRKNLSIALRFRIFSFIRVYLSFVSELDISFAKGQIIVLLKIRGVRAVISPFI